MKLAFFSDIHANLPALESFFDDLEKVSPDATYCLGDLVGYNVWPNEIVNEIRSRQIPTIMGNHDEALINPIKEDEISNRGITRSLVSNENREYLIALPRHLKLFFKSEEGFLNVLLVHGSPESISEYLIEDYPEDKVLDMMKEHGADVLLCGHTHKPYYRQIAINESVKHIINIGSVGKPKDGDPRGCYVVMEIGSSLSNQNEDAIQVEFRRFNYDVEKAAKAVKASEFPDEYAEALKMAK